MTGVNRVDERFALAVEAAVEDVMTRYAASDELLDAIGAFHEASGGTQRGALGLLKTGTVQQREVACHVLGRLRCHRATQSLMDLLSDYSPLETKTRPKRGAAGHVRVLRGAARALRQLREPGCVATLVALLGHPDAQRRGNAALALGWVDNRAAVDPLLPLLADPAWSVRGNAAEALGDIGDPGAVDGLVAHLRRLTETRFPAFDNSPAASGLLRFREPGFREMLEVAWALGALRDERAVEVLASVLDDPRSDIPEWAAGALADIGSARARDALVRCLATAEPIRQALVARCLADAHDPRALSALEELLRDDDTDVRCNAILGLEALGGRGAVRLLLGALDDSDGGVRASAISALGSLRSRRATRPLMAVVAGSAPGSDLWAEAVEALGRIRAREAVPLMLGRARSQPSCAIPALARICDARAVPVLVAALCHRDRDLRITAARALGRLGDPAALPGLDALLVDPWPSVRHVARQALDRFR